MDMPKKKLLLLCICVMSLLSGCAQHVGLLGETAKLAFLGQSDVQLPVQKIEQLPYASAYLKVGKAPQAFVVLAVSEQGLQKWITADKNMVVTSHGRIVKTIGFGENITYTNNLTSDPIALGLLKPETPKKWHTQTTWSQVFRGGYEIISEFENKGIEQITILDKPRSLVRFDEKVFVPALNNSYTNTYWLNPDNGNVVKTFQYMGPGLAQIQFTILKPYVQ
jgi:uncharacterized protein YceK